jgi:hypothetical protein
MADEEIVKPSELTLQAFKDYPEFATAYKESYGIQKSSNEEQLLLYGMLLTSLLGTWASTAQSSIPDQTLPKVHQPLIDPTQFEPLEGYVTNTEDVRRLDSSREGRCRRAASRSSLHVQPKRSTFH